jgi:release factor glutamine methyltransferase
MKTVLEILQSTTAYFQKSGVESPRLNIEHLLAQVMGIKRMELYLQFDRPLGEEQLGPLRALVKRRAQGEPLQHILGSVEFMGRPFVCDPRALVPRPETEQLAARLLELFKTAPPRRVADVGTGSGVLALSLADRWPEAEVHAVDISETALDLAKQNAEALGLGGRIQFHLGHLTQPLSAVAPPAHAAYFDLLVANLPYIPTGEIADLSREVRHDPVSALDGGEDGTLLLRALIRDATAVLRGNIALEIGHDQSTALGEALVLAGYRDIRVETDYQRRNRFLFATHG